MNISAQALAYHKLAPQGKLAIAPSKPLNNLSQLALAYTPGVGAPCQEIAKDPTKVYDYTGIGNLVAVITNGTAVLGYKNIGPAAAKPVMEGKSMLFKKLANIDAFDIEIQEEDPDRLVAIIQAIAPTFGGINLEDIRAPDCFYVEKKLKQLLNIPVVHDDQHCTAIVVAAALENALLIAKKRIENLRVVVHGAGASAIASASLLCEIGVQKNNLIMLDSQGVIRKDRLHLPPSKAPFATEAPIHTLEEAIENSDFFLGLSVGNVLTPSHLLRMAKDPIVFALANPNPEISYEKARNTRSDIIIGTGLSDYPNQINNVLAFPYLFRGLLDARATLNNPIKIAAAKAIASIVHLPNPKPKSPPFGPEYFIPTPLDERLLTHVASSVKHAALATKPAKSDAL